MYIVSGDSWNRRDKLAEMRETPNLMYDLVGDEDGRIVAFVSYVLDDADDHGEPTTFVYELHVHASWAKLGIGRSLIEGVLARSPAHRMTLRVFTRNRPAREFYRRLQFEPDLSLCDDFIMYLQRQG